MISDLQLVLRPSTPDQTKLTLSAHISLVAAALDQTLYLNNLTSNWSLGMHRRDGVSPFIKCMLMINSRWWKDNRKREGLGLSQESRVQEAHCTKKTSGYTKYRVQHHGKTSQSTSLVWRI